MDTAPRAEPSATAGYEFTESENGVIGAAGFWVSTWGVFSLIGSALNALAGVLLLVKGGLGGAVAGIALGALAIIPMLVGIRFLRTGKALQQVVWSEGNDIGHLMGAVRNLGSAFRIQIIAVMSWIAILILFMAVFFETQVRGG